MDKNTLKTNFIESGYYAFDGVAARNIFYYLLFCNKIVDKSLFTESILQVCRMFPKLGSIFVKGVISDKWEPISDISKDNLPIKFYDVEANDNKSFEKEVFKLFESQNNIEMDISKECPMKLFFYINKKICKCAMLFGFHHAFTDGRGAIELIRYIFKTYYSLMNHKNMPSFVNYNSLENFSKKLNDKYGISKKKDSSSKKITPNDVLPIFNEMFEKERETTGRNIRSYNEVVVYSEKFQKIKDWSKTNGLTINDFIVLIVLFLTQKYNKELANSSKYIGTSFTIDARKYIDKKPFMIGNFSGYENFLINSDVIEKKLFNVYSDEIKKFKSSKVLGLDFFLMMRFADHIPTFISRPLIKYIMQKGVDGDVKNRKAISISNVGDLTNSFGKISELIDRVIFISNIPNKLIPQLSVVSCNNVMTISLTKENDKNGVTNEICRKIEQIIDEIIYS